MTTFTSYGSQAMLVSVAEEIDHAEDMGLDVHTVTLILNGQHGEFDLRIEATNADMEDEVIVGRAHLTGGISDMKYEGA